MINVSVFGSTGYAGSELLRLLHRHPEVKLNKIVSQSYAGQEYGGVFANFAHKGEIACENSSLAEAAEVSDVIFLAMPHGVAAKMVNEDILAKSKIIDLGADYRLKNFDVYEKWYGEKHESRRLLDEAVYGLCEIHRDKITQARLIANPGCYTTCSILALYPLIKEKIIDSKSIIIDAKSGVSGAGRSLALTSLFSECNESVKAYKIASHRHTPEIEEQLSDAFGSEISLIFTPHLIPMNRGILSTMYCKPLSNCSYESLREIYMEYYGSEFFIRIANKNVYPETRWVKASNFCDIGFCVDERTNTIIVVSALDNLVKGAAGQAVQNMNLLFGFSETTALDEIPVFPC